MPYRRLPNTMSAVIRTLRAARDQWKNTPVAADRAISADHWAQLDDAAPESFLNRLLKEAGDVDLALAAQAPLTTALSQVGARLTMAVSHFHQVLDLGITRGAFAAGARGYYGRDIGATAVPDLSTQDLVAEAAGQIVDGEAARRTAEGAAHVPMCLPSAAEVAALAPSTSPRAAPRSKPWRRPTASGKISPPSTPPPTPWRWTSSSTWSSSTARTRIPAASAPSASAGAWFTSTRRPPRIRRRPHPRLQRQHPEHKNSELDGE